MTTGTPACASRSARPKPSAPVPPMIGTGVHRRGSLTTDRLPARHEARGTDGAGDRRRGGIGAATCRRLAAEGARVAVTDLNLEAPATWRGEIDGAAFELDVRSTDRSRRPWPRPRPSSARSTCSSTTPATTGSRFFTKTDEEMWDRVLAVNLRGVLAVTHAVLPGHAGARRGRIVNIASEAGRVGSSGSAVYSAAKARRDRLHQGDRARVGALRGDRATRSRPGPIETPLLMAAPERWASSASGSCRA